MASNVAYLYDLLADNDDRELDALGEICRFNVWLEVEVVVEQAVGGKKKGKR